jgi:hypothetical protein
MNHIIYIFFSSVKKKYYLGNREIDSFGRFFFVPSFIVNFGVLVLSSNAVVKIC